MPTFEKVCAEVEATPAYNKRTTEQIYNHFRELAEMVGIRSR
jgi:dihydrodipicolinate synthase/N-acetylneuraminate lyase